jgi:hypothetical protein
MNTKSAFGTTPRSHRRSGAKTLAGVLLVTLGTALAQPALADRDPFPAWQQKQFARRTAQPEMTMTAPRSVLAGRDASFQNWRARESVPVLHDVQSGIVQAHKSEHAGMSGTTGGGAQ